MKVFQESLPFFFCLLLFFCLHGASAETLKNDAETDRSLSTGNPRITVVQFLPLPRSSSGDAKPHERVFTGELFSNRPTDPDVFGYFVPEDYRKVINDSILTVANMHRLNIRMVDSITEVNQGETDVIILGAMKSIHYGKTGTVAFYIDILDGKTFEHRGAKLIEKQMEKKEIPFIMNLPIHTVGHHANDFHPQRVLINYLAYLCVSDMFELIDQRGYALGSTQTTLSY